ncbi:MAG TPA: hypothetical protein QGH10_09385, partial [Armatimonadota bacterium]|nr:hypothetical protein [Armatimonadota bacterium]
GLDGDEVGARGLAIVDKADVAWSLQPRARVIEGKLYVAHAEVAELTGAESAWLWDGPAYRMNEGH